MTKSKTYVSLYFNIFDPDEKKMQIFDEIDFLYGMGYRKFYIENTEAFLEFYKVVTPKFKNIKTKISSVDRFNPFNSLLCCTRCKRYREITKINRENEGVINFLGF